MSRNAVINGQEWLRKHRSQTTTSWERDRLDETVEQTMSDLIELVRDMGTLIAIERMRQE